MSLNTQHHCSDNVNVRILAISNLFPRTNNTRHGIFVARELAEMSRLGAQIHVLVPAVLCPKWLTRLKRWKKYTGEAETEPYLGLSVQGVPYVHFPGKWFNRWSGWSAFLSLRGIALELHQREPFDLIYAQNFFPSVDAALRLGGLLKLPVVGVGIGTDVNTAPDYNKGLKKHFERIARELSGVIARGQSVADRIRSPRGKPVPNLFGMVDCTQFHPVSSERKKALRRKLGIEKNASVIIFVGWIQREKGVFELLEAAKAISQRAPRARFLLCGGGDGIDDFRQTIFRYGLQSRIRLVGSVDPDNIHEWLQSADIFTLPSHMEGMPNAVMEAMACGLPAVVSAVGGIPEALNRSKGATLVPARDPVSLALALSELLEQPRRRTKMSKAAAKEAREKFDIQITVRETLNLLQEFAPQRTTKICIGQRKVV